jgi:acyl-coenzyme A synthetase/AMP-(fatty) acid ligase
MQTHRYALHLTRCYTNSGRIASSDRFALLYSASFAGAVRDIYCALLNGAAVAVFDLKKKELGDLAQFLRRQRITIFFAVATVFRHFCAILTPADQFPALRMIQIGSETVYRADFELWRRHFTGVLAANLGGSEASPIRQFFMDHETSIDAATVPAGYAVEGFEILLVDDEEQELESGQCGEIVVRSRYLSPGYWKQPDLTRASYSMDGEHADLRRFKTGDLGRMTPDGCLIHLGRKDFQVKIRGYRVETAEVESALVKSCPIREAAVAGVRDSAGETQLVAWCVPAMPVPTAPGAPAAAEIQSRLERVLPGYMIPTRFHIVDALPRTPSGKLDRLALAEPEVPTDSARPAAAGDRFSPTVPPRDAIERELERLWAAALGVARCGVEDNFFALGGNSLRAAQIGARLPKALGVSLPFRALFECPTIAQQAERIRGAKRWPEQSGELGGFEEGVL